MKKVLLLTLMFSLILAAIYSFTNLENSVYRQSAEANYKEYCTSCHGEQLKTFIDRKWIYGNSWNEVYKAIKVGYPEDGMPAYDTTFTDKEIGELVDYILNGIENLTRDDFRKGSNWSGVVQSEEQDFQLDTLVSGLGIPWGLAFLPNNDMLITERSGKMHRFRAGEKLYTIQGVPEVLDRGQGGLLDIEVHPDFEKNQWIYFSYSKPKDGKATTAVMRAKLVKDQLSEKRIIFEAQPYLGTRHHYGSRLEFDQEGYLYISVGDRGRRDQNPQSLKNHCGKIHRIHDDGRIPKDNPFVDVKGAMGSIFSYGHRNPQGLALNPGSGQIWDTEHGPRGGDEINVIEKGKNYGWPVISYGINYNGTKFTDLTEKEGMEQPISYWVPSIGACGMTFIHGGKYPNWEGDLLAGSLSFSYLERLEIEGNEVVGKEKLFPGIGRLRDVKMGNDGYIYFSAEDPGRVFRILPK